MQTQLRFTDDFTYAPESLLHLGNGIRYQIHLKINTFGRSSLQRRHNAVVVQKRP